MTMSEKLPKCRWLRLFFDEGIKITKNNYLFKKTSPPAITPKLSFQNMERNKQHRHTYSFRSHTQLIVELKHINKQQKVQKRTWLPLQRYFFSTDQRLYHERPRTRARTAIVIFINNIKIE